MGSGEGMHNSIKLDHTLKKVSGYFSLKVATERVFCNRENEIKIILNSIAINEHIVVVAPRRYGKTSLIMRSIAVSKQPYAMIDLFCVSYQEEVARKLAKAVTDIARQFTSRFRKNTKKIFDALEGIFRSASISFKADGLDVRVDFTQKENPVSQITDLLQGLEALAQKMNKKAVLFLDEFQDILKTDESHKIQSAIRSVAQHSKHVTYLFSGSSRTMLEKIFDDINQPLYLMCRKINLKRIGWERLSQHIREAWLEVHNYVVDDDAIETILNLTERHTYYYNHLCLKLISTFTTINSKTVQDAWDHIVDDELRKIIADLQNLTSNQMKVLTNVSILEVVNAPNSQEFVNKVSMPLSSIQRAVKTLLDSDYLFKLDDGSIKLIDPAIRYFLCKRFEG